ncbi:hypothetical protein MKZ38_010045 [Zalerion maritima]|uniref:Uncharacterized protein n=1 Tax=Zalerion maritima TaxID=339359 RepID=A0AAD5WM57_9PEZI|nr:hypothetical protein MKZ38_010045 [Zalerion maritima]
MEHRESASELVKRGYCKYPTAPVPINNYMTGSCETTQTFDEVRNPGDWEEETPHPRACGLEATMPRLRQIMRRIPEWWLCISGLTTSEEDG